MSPRSSEAHYDGIVEQMLTQHAWKFARRSALLTMLSDPVESPWSALYLTPPDCLSLQYVQTDQAFRVDHEERDVPSGRAIAVVNLYDSTYFGGDLPAQILTAIYTARVAEDRWPADFALAVQYRMEGVFLSAIAEQRTDADEREQMAARVEQRARVRDQRASTPTDATEWDLVAARRRSSAWGAWRYRGGR